MKAMEIQGLYPKKSKQTSIKTSHDIYKYLLDDLEIYRPNQVWATDITYIYIQGRFMYFTAIIDLYSRYILAYELSANLENTFCVQTLKRALKLATPEIFNTDQGSQYTSQDFTKTLREQGIKISMDHKGRCFNNIFAERLWRTVKQEAVYYYRPQTLAELDKCLSNFVTWYNNKRVHQSLQYKTPATIYGGIMH